MRDVLKEDTIKIKLLEAGEFERLIAKTFIFNKSRTVTVESMQLEISNFIDDFLQASEGLLAMMY